MVCAAQLYAVTTRAESEGFARPQLLASRLDSSESEATEEYVQYLRAHFSRQLRVVIFLASSEEITTKVISSISGVDWDCTIQLASLVL